MNTTSEPKSPSENEIPSELPESDLTGIPPQSGHARMPWVLLAFWVANIVFFFFYLIRYALPDLSNWLNP